MKAVFVKDGKIYFWQPFSIVFWRNWSLWFLSVRSNPLHTMYTLYTNRIRVMSVKPKHLIARARYIHISNCGNHKWRRREKIERCAIVKIKYLQISKIVFVFASVEHLLCWKRKGDEIVADIKKCLQIILHFIQVYKTKNRDEQLKRNGRDSSYI